MVQTLKQCCHQFFLQLGSIACAKHSPYIAVKYNTMTLYERKNKGIQTLTAKNDRWAMFRRQKYREISRVHCIFYIYIPCLRIRKKHVISSCISISVVWKLISAYLQLIFNKMIAHLPNYLCQIIWLKIHTLSKTLGIEDNRVAKHRHLVVDNYHNPVTI